MILIVNHVYHTICPPQVNDLEKYSNLYLQYEPIGSDARNLVDSFISEKITSI